MKNCHNGHAPNPDDTNFCTSCGAALIPPEPPKKPVSNVIAIVLLIIFFPVGLYLMWARTRWDRTVKVIVTAVIVVLLILGAVYLPSAGTASYALSFTPMLR